MKFKNIRILLIFIFSGLTTNILWQDYHSLPNIESFNRVSILGVLTSYIIYLVIVSYRTLIILNEITTKKIKFIDWFRLTIKGRFISKFIPQGGNIYRGIILKKSNNLSYNKYISYLGIFSWIDIIINLFVCLILLVILDSELMLMDYRALTIIFYSLLVIFLGPFLFKILVEQLRFSNKFFDKLKIFTTENVIKSLKKITLLNLIKVVLIGILSIFVTVGTYYFSYSFLNLYPDIAKLSLYVCFIRISFVVSMTPGNIGINELLLGTLTELTGGTLVEGITVALIIRLLTYFTLGILSLIFKIQTIQIDSKSSYKI